MGMWRELRKHSIRRPVLSGLLVGAFVLGALSATCGRESGPSEDRSDPAQEIVLAKVGDRTITAADLEFKIKIQFPTMADLEGVADIRQKEQVLKAMIDQYCWVSAGELRKFDRDPEFIKTLELSRAYILSNYTVNKLVYEQASPTEEEIRAYYEENPDQFRLVARAEVSRIIVPERSLADQLRRRILAGEDFVQLVERYSKDPQAGPVGGRMGTVTDRSELRGFGRIPEINEKIMALKAGEITEPIKTEKGWVIFRVDEKSEESKRSLEEGRDEIYKRLNSKKANEIFASTLQSIREELGATTYDEAWDRYVLQLLDEDELLRLAQEEKSIEKRIRLYEGLAERFPDGPRAAQAQFMVGFTYADELENYGEARRHFEEMITKYPDSELVPSARWMLENMEKGLDSLPYAETVRRKATEG